MNQSICPECRSLLATNAPGGSCFACLLVLGVEASEADTAGDVVRTPASMGPAGGAPLSERAGHRIGRYRLRELIGEGGFGTVWMAEQEEPVRRKVAVKLLKPGMDSRQIVARFEAERQALAMMDHPSIARVFDGGTTDQGRPYFVMELVKGVRITEYCDAACLSTEERLRLFIEVCQAVQHAHQKGVIHRDLKPSNILVTEQDGRAIPKVIDFGIAKATEQKLTEATLFTRFNQLVGTPAYMSPEQAGLGSLDIDTRSDIYALGVLLYELLTGCIPFPNDEFLKAGLDEVLRTIRENEPARPSTRLSTLAKEELLNTARRRGADPTGLGRQVRGELDWIVMKALEKDRSRRYETANAFATDLRCYLDGKAVSAAPPTIRYRFGKFAHKNRMAIAIATTFAALLIAGVAATAWQAIRARRMAKTAGEQRARAERGEANLRQGLYVSQMSVAFRSWQDGRVVRARTLLDQQRPSTNEPDLRSFEWRYLWKRAGASELFTLTNAAMWGLAISPDGHTVAGFSANREGQYRVGLWNVAARQLFAELDPEPGHLFSLAFSPDGRTLAAAYYDQRRVKLWDVAHRRLVGQLETKDGPLIGVSFSPDGNRIVTTGGWMYQTNAAGGVVLWDAATTQAIRRFVGSQNWVYQATFSPDGQTLAASDGAGAVNLWNVSTGEMIARLTGHNGFVEPVTFSLDGEVLATGDQLGHVWLWQWRSRRVESVFRAHDLPIYSILFSPDERQLFTASRDQTARMWDRQSRRELARFAGHTGGVTAAQLLPDGQTLVTSSQDGTLKFWDTRNRFPDDVLETGTEAESDLVFAANSRLVARIERANSNVTFYAVDTGSSVKAVVGQGVAASRDGKLLSLVRGSQLVFFDPVDLHETGGAELGAPLGSLAVSPDGKMIAVRRREFAVNNVVIFDVDQQREVKVFPTPDDEWAPLQFARRGTLLLTAGKTSNKISAWDTTSWQPVAHYEGIQLTESRSVTSIAVSPDGNSIATGGGNGLVLVWDVDQPLHPRVLQTGAGQAHSTAFSPDGKTLAIGSLDSSIRLWNVAERQEIAILRGHSSYVHCVTFSSDGRTLASASYDKTVRFWRAPSLEEIAVAEKNRLPWTTP